MPDFFENKKPPDIYSDGFYIALLFVYFTISLAVWMPEAVATLTT